MNAAVRQIETGMAAAAFRLADAAPALMLYGPAAALTALLAGWIAGLPALRWAAAG